MSSIVVVSGGFSHERDVSLRSGRRVTTALRDAGNQVVSLDVDSDLIETLQGLANPVVVPMLHGGLGEDGALRQVFDLLAVPYIGSSATASRLTFDKSLATPLVKAAGFHTPAQVALPEDIFRELGAQALIIALGNEFGYPLIVKPARSGSSLGVTKVMTPNELPAALVGAFAYGSVAVIEEFIDGIEIAITVLDLGSGPEPLPTVEIRPESGVYDYYSRYTSGATTFVTPAELAKEVNLSAQQLALGVFDVLGLSQLSRMDIIVRGDTPFFLEANVAPGMTETSLAPLAMLAADLDLSTVFATLVEQRRP